MAINSLLPDDENSLLGKFHDLMEMHYFVFIERGWLYFLKMKDLTAKKKHLLSSLINT